MARIITLHGTYAHAGSDGGADPSRPADAVEWWEQGSDFGRQMQRYIKSDDGPLEVETLVWSGDNSEKERRDAGEKLLGRMQALEAADERYCVLGHSHGGSVISRALLNSADRGALLSRLGRWVTIGTPFAELRKEPFLFQRLPIVMKAVFVASLMLLLMFLFTFFSELIDGKVDLNDGLQTQRNIVAALLTTLPFVLFYFVAWLWDRRKLSFYRPRTSRQARESYAGKWVSLCHEDDEAVQALGSLRTVNLSIFHRGFAVPALSFLSVFMLPLAYLYLVMSPGLMLGITDRLIGYYGISDYERQAGSYNKQRDQLRALRRKLRTMRDWRPDNEINKSVQEENVRRELRELRRKLADERRELRQRFPQVANLDRARRFTSLFLERNGRRCRGGGLCGRGRNVALNSRLLFHLVTDEASSVLIDSDVYGGAVGRLLRYAAPVLLIPLLFGLLAVALVYLVQRFSGLLSGKASSWLDSLTWAQIRRSALGNDTEEEVAFGTRRHPNWLDEHMPYLPSEVAVPITEKSNAAMAASLGKFRDAISELALLDWQADQTDTILSYLTWDELIHTSYFDVPEFQQLVAVAICEAEGFEATDELKAAPYYAAAKSWLATQQRAKTA